MTTTFDNFIASLEEFIENEYLRQKDPQALLNKLVDEAKRRVEKDLKESHNGIFRLDLNLNNQQKPAKKNNNKKRKPNWFEDWED